VQPTEVLDLLARPHLLVEPALFGHVAELLPVGVRQRPALPAHRAGVGLEHTHDDPHGRRLAGPVRADESEHLARPYGEADPIEGELAFRRVGASGEALAQFADLEHQIFSSVMG
jgi:hypothetical protein